VLPHFRLHCVLHRTIGTPTPGGEPTNFWSARVAVISEFQYIVDAVPPDTDTSGGFNFDFDNNFTGG
jgi:hypothetical protein